MNLSDKRKEELLNNCIDYLAELWGNYGIEDWNIEWQDVIGLSSKEMKHFGLTKQVEV